MNSRDLLLALNCCSPLRRDERDCTSCPLYNDRNCHNTLCTSAIDIIMHEHATIERYVSEINRIQQDLSNLFTK